MKTFFSWLTFDLLSLRPHVLQGSTKFIKSADFGSENYLTGCNQWYKVVKLPVRTELGNIGYYTTQGD